MSADESLALVVKENRMNRENTKLMAMLLLCFALSLIALAQALKP
jgi:hypothetical protein